MHYIVFSWKPFLSSLIILLLLSLPLYEPRNIMADIVILSLRDIPTHDAPSTTSEYDADPQPATL
jgi:hypothetical protein